MKMVNSHRMRCPELWLRGYFARMSWNERKKALEGRNWWLSVQRGATHKIYRKRSPEVAENGRTYLGEVFRTSNGWKWKDNGGRMGPNACLGQGEGVGYRCKLVCLLDFILAHPKMKCQFMEKFESANS